MTCVFRNEIYCIPDFKYSSINWEAGRLTTCSKGFRSSGSTKRDKTEAALVVLLATWTWFIWCLFCMFNMWNRIEIDTSATCICLQKNSAWSCFFGYASVCFSVLLFCIWWVYGVCSILDILHASPSGEETSMSNGVWNFWLVDRQSHV